MAALSFDSLYKTTRKGDLAPVTYLTGDEEVLKNEIVALATDVTLDGSTRDFNLDVRSAGNLDPEQLIALVDTPPMLAERRVVVIKALEQWRKNSKQWKALYSYTENPSPNTVLILLHRAGGGSRDRADQKLVRNSRHADITRLEPQRLEKWIVMLAGRLDIEIEAEAAHHLATVVGSDLAQLSAEINKLAAGAGEGSTVTRRDVETMVGVNHGETVEDWLQAVVERKFQHAIELLEFVLQQPGVTGVRLVSNLGTALIGTRYARAQLDRGLNVRKAESAVFALIRSAKPWGIGNWKSEAARWTRAAGNWSANQLDHALTVAHETDRALKSSTVTTERGKLMNMLLDIGACVESS